MDRNSTLISVQMRLWMSLRKEFGSFEKYFKVSQHNKHGSLAWEYFNVLSLSVFAL